MRLTDTVATLGVGTGDERVLLRLTDRTLTAEVTPEYWARIEQSLQRSLDDGTLIGGVLAVGTSRTVRSLKRWYLGPHDIAAVEVAFDGERVCVHRHGVADLFRTQRPSPQNNWYATLDVVGGCWSDGFEAAAADAFVTEYRALREARLRSLGYAAGVGARVLAGTAAAAAIAAAVAWTMRGPRRPDS